MKLKKLENDWERKKIGREELVCHGTSHGDLG